MRFVLCLAVVALAYAQSGNCTAPTAACILTSDCTGDSQTCCGGTCQLYGSLSTERLPAGAQCLPHDLCSKTCDEGLVCVNNTCQVELRPGCECNNTIGACYGDCDFHSNVCLPSRLPPGSNCSATATSAFANTTDECSTACQANGTCAAPSVAAYGTECNLYRSCAGDQYCSGYYQYTEAQLTGIAVASPHLTDAATEFVGVCQIKRRVGEFCLPSAMHALPCWLTTAQSGITLDVNPCEADAKCFYNATSRDTVCVRVGKEGEACTTSDECTFNTTCDAISGTCVARCALADGAACTAPEQCANGQCFAGICGVPAMPTISPGGTCTTSAQCIGDASVCVGGQCESRTNSHCNTTSDCGLGTCVCDGSGQTTCQPRANPCWRQMAALQAALGSNDTAMVRTLEASLLCCQSCRGLSYHTVGVAQVVCDSDPPTLVEADTHICPTTAIPEFVGCDTARARWHFPPIISLCLPCAKDQYEVSPCTLRSNRVCAACSTCGAGQYETQKCTPDHDRTCKACKTCGSSSFETTPCTPDHDRTCKACTPCKAGEYEATSCTASHDRTCKKCSSCGAGQFQAAACSATQNTVCKACSTCSSDEYLVQACTATHDTVCNACSERCDPLYGQHTYSHFESDFYETQTCGNGHDRICTPCTLCNANEYERYPCRENANRGCLPCTVCKVNQYETEPCRQDIPIHGFYDRVCSDCSTCGADQIVVTPCDATHDTVCAPKPSTTVPPPPSSLGPTGGSTSMSGSTGTTAGSTSAGSSASTTGGSLPPPPTSLGPTGGSTTASTATSSATDDLSHTSSSSSSAASTGAAATTKSGQVANVGSVKAVYVTNAGTTAIALPAPLIYVASLLMVVANTVVARLRLYF